MSNHALERIFDDHHQSRGAMTAMIKNGMITTAAPGLPRRGFLRMCGTAGALLTTGALASACVPAPLATATGSPTIRLGFVSPTTGVLAPFGAADTFVVASMRRYFSQNPIIVGGRAHTVEILERDSQSNVNRSADLANDLIVNHGVHLMLVAATPDTTHPVSDQCETNAVPCIATVTPWEPWFFGRAGSRDAPFRWTFNFFWGLRDVGAVYADMWDAVGTNKVAGGLWPDDADGRAWGDPAGEFPTAQFARGYRIVGTGSYPSGTRSFSRLIDRFSTADSQILVGVPLPSDFTTFWKQAAQQGFRPKIATIGKALLFPSGVEALGRSGTNLSTEVWWSPNHPFSSSLTGQTARQLADAYTVASGRQWIQPIGFVHALFEVAAAAFSAVSDIDDRRGLAAAISALRINSVVGPLDWTSGPVPNVATTPLVGGQWRSGTNNPFELVIVSNRRSPEIPAGGTVQSLGTAS
jgi:branched-chain amino acid transport system substrate-binding protein